MLTCFFLSFTACCLVCPSYSVPLGPLGPLLVPQEEAGPGGRSFEIDSGGSARGSGGGSGGSGGKGSALVGDGPLYGALSYDTDGTGDCHLFSRELAKACETKGVQFRYNTETEHLVADDQRVTGVAIRKGDGTSETLEADAVVVSAGCWSGHLTRPLGLELPIYPVKGYSFTVPLKDPGRAPVSTIHDDNYKVVSTRLGERLRASGFVELDDFNRDIPEARLATIRKSVESRFPGCADLEAAETWTGFRPMTPDGPAIIGRGPRENLFLNTGHGTFGWTLSAGSASVISQLIDGEAPSVCLDAFRPGRFAE